MGSHFFLTEQTRTSPENKSEHTPSISRSHCQLLPWGHQPRAGLGSTTSKSINLIIACVPRWVERDCSKENKHATAAGGTSALQVPGLARSSASSLFPQHRLKLQTQQPPAQQMPHSANRNSMPQRVSQALFRLMLVKKLPHSYPFQGKNSGNSSHRLNLPWDALCRIQTSALHSTYSNGTGTEQPGVLDHLQSITAQISLHRRIQ